MLGQRMHERDAGGDVARLLHAASRERLNIATADLFLPHKLRLSEWQRSTMESLLAGLIGTIENDLRAALAERLRTGEHAALDAGLTSDTVEIAAPILAGSAALRDAELVALLLRRVEEHRLHRQSHSAAAAPEGLFLDLVRDKDEAISAAAMAVLVAQSRRLDRFQEPLIPSPELPAEIEHRLVWTVAGALRSYLTERHGIAPRDADDALAAVVQARLAHHDEGGALEARCRHLVGLLDSRDRLDGAMMARLLPEAGLSLLLAALSLRTNLAVDAVWDLASEPTGRGLPILLRSARLTRDQAGTIMVDTAGGAPLDRDEKLVRQLDVFDTMSAEEAYHILALWRADPLYRAAVREAEA